jgi:hypothetical protein
MVTAPPFSAVTSPVAFTDATVTSELSTHHRPESTLPFASFRVAVACVDWPATTSARSAPRRPTRRPPHRVDERRRHVTGTIVLRPPALAVIPRCPRQSSSRGRSS